MSKGTYRKTKDQTGEAIDGCWSLILLLIEPFRRKKQKGDSVSYSEPPDGI